MEYFYFLTELSSPTNQTIINTSQIHSAPFTLSTGCLSHTNTDKTEELEFEIHACPSVHNHDDSQCNVPRSISTAQKVVDLRRVNARFGRTLEFPKFVIQDRHDETQECLSDDTSCNIHNGRTSSPHFTPEYRSIESVGSVRRNALSHRSRFSSSSVVNGGQRRQGRDFLVPRIRKSRYIYIHF